MGDRGRRKGREGDGIYKRKGEEEQEKGRGEKRKNSVYCSLAKCAVRCIWPLKPEGGERRIEGRRQTYSKNMKERKEEKQGHEFNKCAAGNGGSYIQEILNNVLFVGFSLYLSSGRS